MVRYRTKKR